MKKVTRKLRVKSNRFWDAVLIKRLQSKRVIYWKLLEQSQNKAV